MNYLPAGRILFGSKKDNFWEMGDTGPCGPCSEIHVDMRPQNEVDALPGADLVNNDHPQVIEIWNNVFMEFNRLANGQLVSLPAKHVDTGMGFERLARVVQGKTSNYDSDVFTPLIEVVTGLAHYQLGQDEKKDIAVRVIVDHIRAVAFCISDGAIPSNNKAGYVIRRILRRAVRYGYSFLNFREPFFHKLVKPLAAQFAGVFDELGSQAAFVEKIILEEERSFLRTLEAGIRRFEEFAAANPNIDTLPGATAFELYDTFGFPYDLTQVLARERGIIVDQDGFQKALNAQKERSRKDSSVKVGDWVEVTAAAPSFVGYDVLACQTHIIRYRPVDSKGTTLYQIELAQNPFYAESGGQVGDTGTLTAPGEFGSYSITITDCRKENGQYLLLAQEVNETLLASVPQWSAAVNAGRRKMINANHSATHLLHAALRGHLGQHVQQKGSLVNAEELRFDFSHGSKIVLSELQVIEAEINEKIFAQIELKEIRYTTVDKAKEMGAMALFGEKYGSEVRVIVFDPAYSVELCGGTHMDNTGQIGLIKIIAESSVSAGIRRITALTGQTALHYLYDQSTQLGEVKAYLKPGQHASVGIEELMERNKSLEKRIQDLENEKITALADTISSNMILGPGHKVLAQQIDLPAEQVKNLLFRIGQQNESTVLALGYIEVDKVGLQVYIGKAVQANFDAREIIKAIGPLINGGGGGQPFYATAGGKNPAGLSAALAQITKLVNPN